MIENGPAEKDHPGNWIELVRIAGELKIAEAAPALTKWLTIDNIGEMTTRGFTEDPHHAFEANALYLEVIRLAYNLVTAFQRTCLPQEWQRLTLSKLRRRLFWLPGELTRPQHQPTLRLAKSLLIATRGEKILHRVQRLKPLEG